MSLDILVTKLGWFLGLCCKRSILKIYSYHGFEVIVSNICECWKYWIIVNMKGSMYWVMIYIYIKILSNTQYLFLLLQKIFYELFNKVETLHDIFSNILKVLILFELKNCCCVPFLLYVQYLDYKYKVAYNLLLYLLRIERYLFDAKALQICKSYTNYNFLR